MNEASGIRFIHRDARLTEVVHEWLRQAEVPADADRTLINAPDSARVVPSEPIPPDVVTMNSTVILEDRASGRRKEAAVVYPGDADPAQGKLSVFSPAGRTLLGLRVGDEAELPVSYRRRARMKVVKILYQPEVADDLASDSVPPPRPAA